MVVVCFSMRRLLVQDGCSSDTTENMAALVAGNRFSCAHRRIFLNRPGGTGDGAFV